MAEQTRVELMSGESVDIPLDDETSAKLLKLSKKELIDKFASAAIEAYTFRCRCDVFKDDERKLQGEIDYLKKALADEAEKLAKAESYVEQGRTMINAVMERWYEYDV